MIKVKIGGFEREFDGKPDWIHEHFEGRRAEGGAPCVRVHVNCGEIDMILASKDCVGTSGGGSRLPNKEEEKIFQLWEKFQLNSSTFSIGNLIAFLKQIRSFC